MIGLTLYDIVRGLIKEEVSNDEVLDAIDNKYHVRIRYDDGLGDGGNNPKGSRIIQPVALGTTKKGYPVVRAFQINGNSRRGAPKWKFFRLDRVTSWRPMRNKKFFAPPDPSYGEYNRVGDRTMGTFIDNAKFDDIDNPLVRARAERYGIMNAPKVSSKNVQGPIVANQQWKKNVFTSQPNSKKYAEYASNVNKSSNKDSDYWSDYEKALQQANMQNDVPKPDEYRSGPVRNSDNEDLYDVENVDFDINNFVKNNNKR